MKKLYLPVFIVLIFIFSCQKKMKKVDVLYENGKVYTVDKDFSVVESFAVKEGIIIATGSSDSLKKIFNADTIIDLQQKTVYPGFIDAHCHFLHYGIGLSNVDLTGTTSFSEVIEKATHHYNEMPSAWLIGHGWDQNDWENKEFPDKTRLDKLFPAVPVLLTRIDGHAAIANRKALELAGITTEINIDGGEIRKKNGKLTGILIDNAVDTVRAAIPKVSLQQKQQALLQAQKKCFAVGLTGVHDAGLDKQEILLIDSLQKKGELKMRINAMINPTQENFEEFLYKGQYKTDYLTVRTVKLYADGALGSRGAKLIEPYCDDPKNSGLLVNPPEYLSEICEKAYKQHYQVATHAIGDSANRLMLHIYSKILTQKNDRRWRIEHAQIVHPKDMTLYGKYNIVPSIQPTHATSDMYWADERLGKQRVKTGYAYLELVEQNDWLPTGSDFPVENINPVYGFYAATIRKDLKGWPKEGFQTENALSRQQALRAMTIWAAKAAFEEKEKGSIEPGKFADFVVLDRDILTVPEKEIPDAKVVGTFIAGEKVFQARP